MNWNIFFLKNEVVDKNKEYFSIQLMMMFDKQYLRVIRIINHHGELYVKILYPDP